MVRLIRCISLNPLHILVCVAGILQRIFVHMSSVCSWSDVYPLVFHMFVDRCRFLCWQLSQTCLWEVTEYINDFVVYVVIIVS